MKTIKKPICKECVKTQTICSYKECINIVSYSHFLKFHWCKKHAQHGKKFVHNEI